MYFPAPQFGFPELNSEVPTTPPRFRLFTTFSKQASFDIMAYCYEDFDSEIDEEILEDYMPIRAKIDKECNEEVEPNASSSTTVETKQDWNILTISSDLKLSDVERRDLFSEVEAQWHTYSNEKLCAHSCLFNLSVFLMQILGMEK